MLLQAWHALASRPNGSSQQECLQGIHAAAEAINCSHNPLQLDALVCAHDSLLQLCHGGSGSACLRDATRALQAAVWHPRDAAMVPAACAALLLEVSRLYWKNDKALGGQQGWGRQGASMDRMRLSKATQYLDGEVQRNAAELGAALCKGAGATGWGWVLRGVGAGVGLS